MSSHSVQLSAQAKSSLPTHVAVIMDGNGRWAKERNLPRVEGHRNGAESVRAVVRAAGEFGIKYLTLYAFSMENWNRPKEEVDTLMKYLDRYLRNEVGELQKNNVRLEVIGQIYRLPEFVQEQLKKTTAALQKNNGLTLVLALSYGGRTEIVETIRKIAAKVKTGKLDPEEINEGLEVIDRNARAQTRIIEDLLDMSRILSGKVRLDVQRLELAPVIQAALQTVEPAAQAKEIRLQAILDPLAQPVSGDPSRLQQIFWNLLSNAIKFTPRGGRVQILLERVNSHLEVSVTDTGVGISPEFLPYVFERFRQADASSTRRHSGLGLGLAIAKHLAELHGGSIRAKSGGPSQGSTFTVILPLAVLHFSPEDRDRRHPAHQGEPALLGDLPDLKGISVMVVDDEEDARKLVALVLSKAGAIVRAAASAAEAREILAANVPDVLISDIGMPDEDGHSLMRSIRALPPDRGGKVPAIALSAYTRTEDRIRAISAGFQMHLPKPADTLELLTMVESLAGKA